MSDVVVRPAEVEDGPAIGQVQVQVWREAYAGLMLAEPLAAMDPGRIGGLWTERLADPPYGLRTGVALVGDALVGFAAAGPSGDDPPLPGQRLFAINCVRGVHGTGVSHALLDAVLEPGPCSLWVVVGNDRAIGFYERRGFVVDGATQDDVRLGVTEQRMVRT